MVGTWGFLVKRYLRAKGQRRCRLKGPTECGSASGVGPMPPHGVGVWLPSSDSPLVPVDVSGKIEAWLFVSSNSENISLVTFRNPKIAENKQLTLWHLVNRLVPENA